MLSRGVLELGVGPVALTGAPFLALAGPSGPHFMWEVEAAEESFFMGVSGAGLLEIVQSGGELSSVRRGF